MAARRIYLGVILATMTFGIAVGQEPANPEKLSVDAPPMSVPMAPAAPPSPIDTLTAPPTATAGHSLPPGTVTSPWVGPVPAGADCCGPVGRNGPLTYELYGVTGPSLPIAGGEFIGALKTGWVVGGGGRSLWFNPAGDRAWVLDLGLTYTHNFGRSQRIYDIFTPSSQLDQNTGLPTAPDQLNPFFIRELTRTSFNFALGHDWFLSGPGYAGTMLAPNWRVGAEVGGRWGTAHVDLIPIADTTNYLRKHDVYHGVFLGVHSDYERPLGAAILFAGLRAQWGYTWTDLIPPQDGEIQDINLLMTFGVRY